MKKILLLTTGGTIASGASDNGLIPEMTGEQLIRHIGMLEVELTIKDLFQLDSSNIQPEDWIKIADCIYRMREQYDGIVITHGTDTMAYTASALTFMLPGIDRPVVLTGSQLPMQHPLSDAVANLKLALAMAQTGSSGIFIAFDRKVLLGCRAVKVRTNGFDAFESVNHPPVGEFDAKGLHIRKEALPVEKGPCRFLPALDDEVCLIKLIPGLKPALFDMVRLMGCHGVVIEAFGAGGVTDINRDVAAAIARMVRAGIVVIICSQCLYEETDMTLYEVGRHALEAGAVSAGDMTSEAVVTKLMWTLGQEREARNAIKLFEVSLHGEKTA